MAPIIFTATGLRRRATVRLDGDRFDVDLQTKINARWAFSGYVQSATRNYGIRRAFEWVSEEPVR